MGVVSEAKLEFHMSVCILWIDSARVYQPNPVLDGPAQPTSIHKKIHYFTKLADTYYIRAIILRVEGFYVKIHFFISWK